jgi:aminoglycoside phosphotransferase (APT) family kinase protein
MVPGEGCSVDIYDRLRQDPALAAHLGEQLGTILANQHTRVPAHELVDWLPARQDWPRVEDLPALPLVVEDPALLARMERALARREAIASASRQRVLIHGDFGLHNIAFAPATLDVAGVYDYEGAVFGDRHLDFKNLLLQGEDGSEPLLNAAAESYTRLTGLAIDRERVWLLNAIEAIGFLAYRHGHAPDEVWCGRTLAQDLAWANASLRAVGIE